MKRFFNLPTIIVLAIIAISIIVEVLSPVINWLAIIWMVTAAVWAVAARLNHMETQDWMQRYDSQTTASNTLKKTWTGALNELTELRGKYETLTNDKQRLSEQYESQSENIDDLEASLCSRMLEINELRGKYETAVQELALANQKLNELAQNISARKPTIKLKTKKHKAPEDKE